MIMKLIYYKGTDPSKSTGSFTAIYSDFTGNLCKWFSDYNKTDETESLTDEEVYSMIKQHNLKNKLSDEGLKKYEGFKK